MPDYPPSELWAVLFGLAVSVVVGLAIFHGVLRLCLLDLIDRRIEREQRDAAAWMLSATFPFCLDQIDKGDRDGR